MEAVCLVIRVWGKDDSNHHLQAATMDLFLSKALPNIFLLLTKVA